MLSLCYDTFEFNLLTSKYIQINFMTLLNCGVYLICHRRFFIHKNSDRSFIDVETPHNTKNQKKYVNKEFINSKNVT